MIKIWDRVSAPKFTKYLWEKERRKEGGWMKGGKKGGRDGGRDGGRE